MRAKRERTTVDFMATIVEVVVGCFRKVLLPVATVLKVESLQIQRIRSKLCGC